MNFFEEWIAKEERPKLHREAVKGLDRYDRADFDQIEREYKEFRVARNQFAKKVATGSHLASDAFFGLFKVEPQLRDRSEMRPSYLANLFVEEEIQKTPEWQRLRSFTEGDLVAAASGFMAIKDDLAILFDKIDAHLRAQIEEMERQQELLDQMMDEYQALIDQQADEMAGLSDEELADLARQQSELSDRIQELIQQLGQQAQELQDEINSAVAGAVPVLRKSLSDACDANEELGAIANGCGVEPGQLQRMSAKERLKLAKRVEKNPAFKHLAELVGPMRRVALAEQQRKVYHTFEEVYDVGVGSDLGRILPSELLALSHPVAKLDFYRKFTEGNLLQYEMRANEKVGRGGIVFLMDNSGSMMGWPEMWAKSLGLATLAIAKEQKRSFYGIHFGSASELMCFDFRDPGEITLDRVMDFAEWFWSGGTDFMTPLTKAYSILREEELAKGYVEGDIIFVTDGICTVHPTWLEQFKAEQERMGFRVWGICIGNYPGPMPEICDWLTTLPDLMSPESVREIFRGL